jgi:hypothetical protein
MAAVPSTRARWSTGPDLRSAARVWTSGNAGATEPFGSTLSLVNRRRERQKGGPSQ